MKGLAIGAYKLDFLANLVASDLFEKCKNKFKELLWRGIYRDKVLLLSEVNKLISEINKKWRYEFQSGVNTIASN